MTDIHCTEPGGTADSRVSELVVPSPRVRHGEPCPVTFSQRRMWTMEQLLAGTSANNVAFAFGIAGAVDVAVLQASLTELSRRHEALRTTFSLVGGDVRQVVHEPSALDLPVRRLHIPPEQYEAEACRVVSEELRTPFDLSYSPPVRALLITLDETNHVLAIFIHHIIIDGRTYNLILRELPAVYAALCEGDSPSLPEPEVQCTDCAAWEAAHLTEAALAADLAYWRKKLDAAPTALNLHSRPQEGTVCELDSSMKRFRFGDKELLDGLRGLAARHRTSLDVVLLVLFQSMLYRYTGSDDVVVASPMEARPPGAEAVAGFFDNLVILRGDLSGNPTIAELLARAEVVMIEARLHSRLPFDRLVTELRPPREASRSPLAQILFAILKEDRSRRRAGGTEWRALDVPWGVARPTDLELFFIVDGDTLLGVMLHRLRLFGDAWADQMIRHLENIARAIVRKPELRLSQLPMLADEEHRRLLVDWSGTTAPVPHRCVHDLISEQATATPELTAVSLGSRRLTYRELERHTNQVAHALRVRGIGPGSLVAICVERCIEAIIGILGVLKAGGAFVPIAPDLPDERLRYLFADMDACALLTQEGLRERLALNTTAEILCLDSRPTFAGYSAVGPTPLASLDDLAYVIYTSGSTGEPKGVAVEHAALANLVSFFIRHHELGPGKTASQLASLGFDVAVGEIFPPLASGAKLTLYDGIPLDPMEVWGWLDAEKVDFAYVPTPLMNAILREHDLPRIRTSLIWTGGDRLLHRPGTRFTPRLLNDYGPTEATVSTTSGAVLPDRLGPPDIGRPIPNTRVYILDRHLNPVPVGVPGELYIGGAGLARGYLNKPDLTVERFVVNPFEPTKGLRLYRTGDAVCYAPDGRIEYLWRLDDQVKVRGFRVELGDVEAALARHPGIGQAAVTAREDGSGERYLVGYFVPDGQPPTDLGLRQYLRDRLPDYMVPTVLVPLDALPLTSSGKVDRRRLPSPPPHPTSAGTATPVPTGIDHQIAKIWAEVLEVNNVGLDDNFFLLGGHSLVAATIAARVRETLGTNVRARDIFERPTIRQLLSTLDHYGVRSS